MQTYLIHPAHEKPIEARATDFDLPGTSYYSGRDWFVIDQLAKYGSDESPVTVRNSLSWTPIFACIRYISGTLASLAWRVFQLSSDGRTRLPLEENISWTLDLQANPEQTAMAWREVMLKDALTWGNGYAEIERTNGGKPLWLWRIDPQRVIPWRDGNGPLYYIVKDADGSEHYIDSPNMFHLRGLGEDGLVGLSPIQIFRKTIQLGVNQQSYAAAFFRRGPMPGGILKYPQGGRDEKKDAEDRERFERAYCSSKNAGRVIVLRGGMEFEPVNFPNTDAQLIESMALSAEEVARIYGVPLHKIAVMKAATNNNIEHQSIEAVQDCLMPWARRLETEADVKLFSRTNQGRRMTRISLASLTRGDSITQSNSLRAQVTAGIKLLDEAREELDLNPLPDALGSEPLIQGAMVPLDRIINPPEPPPPASPQAPLPEKQPSTEPVPGDGQDASSQDTQNRIRESVIGLLGAAYSRILRIENDKAARAEKAGKLEAWAEEFYGNGHQEHVASEIRGIVDMLAIAAHLKIEAAEKARQLARLHIEASEKSVSERGDWQSFRSWQQARAHVDYLLSFRPAEVETLAKIQKVLPAAQHPDAGFGHFTFVFPEQPTPIVNVTAPNVTVNIPEQPAMKFENNIVVPPAQIPPQPDIVVNAPITVQAAEAPHVENNITVPAAQIPQQPDVIVNAPVTVHPSEAPRVENNISVPAGPPIQNVVNVPEAAQMPPVNVLNVASQDADPIKRTLEYNDPMGKPSAIVEETASGQRRRRRLQWDGGRLISIEYERANG